MEKDIAYVRQKTREKIFLSSQLKSEKPVGKVKRSEKSSIFRLQIYIFRLKIRIFKLQICIFRLKIEFSSDVFNFLLGHVAFCPESFFVYLCRKSVAGRSLATEHPGRIITNNLI